MKTISRRDFEILKAEGLIKYKTKFNPANFTVVNKNHKSRAKSYIVCMTSDIEKRLNELNDSTEGA